jgi:AraC-like DNA-binding protein
MKAVFLYDETALANMIFNVYTDDIIRELRSRVDIEKRFFSKEEVIRSPHLFSDVDFVFASWGMPKFTEEEIKTYLPSLKCIFYGAGTVQSFARPFLNSGVRIFSAWAANAVPVAEMAAAMIILANKGYFVCNRVFNKSDWRASRNVFETCLGNYGETVGIIGAGTIGKLVISLLKNYRLNVLVFDPFLSDEAADELGVTKCDLETLSVSLTYNYGYLSRYFKERTGISFTEYVNRYRITEACYLIGNTEKTFLSISCECGFDSLRSFNRNFIKIMGITPGDYKAKIEKINKT